MKRFLRNFLLCACMMVLLSVCAFAAQVSVSDMKVKVNGVEQTPQAYLIDGNNYFKLRDLAMMLRETPSRFEVGYDSETINNVGSTLHDQASGMKRTEQLKNQVIKSGGKKTSTTTSTSKNKTTSTGSNRRMSGQMM